MVDVANRLLEPVVIKNIKAEFIELESLIDNLPMEAQGKPSSVTELVAKAKQSLDEGKYLNAREQMFKTENMLLLQDNFPERFNRIPGDDDIEYGDIDILLTESGESNKDIESIFEWKGVLTYWECAYGILRLHRTLKGLFDEPDSYWRKRFTFKTEYPQSMTKDVGVFNNISSNSYIGNKYVNLKFFTKELIAGAKIYIKKISDDKFEIGCTKTSKVARKVLEYDDNRKLTIKERQVDFEVDEVMVLCESRYSNLAGLEYIDITNNETASKVLQLIFEKIGKKENNIYHCSLDRLLPAVSIFKPYSQSYLEFLLRRGKFKCFYYDKVRGEYFYDPSILIKIKPMEPQVSPGKPILVSATIISKVDDLLTKTQDILSKIKETYG